MTAVILRGDAAHLPIPDNSADLVCTSPPYFGLRAYTDDGEVYDGQIGAEETPAEYIAALVRCTREWLRILKPAGSLFVNIGDKYCGYSGANWGHGRDLGRTERSETRVPASGPVSAPAVYGVPSKSLMGLPWRYALACIDELGLILRAEIVWHKLNGLPESANDRVRRSHEQVFHFTKQPRYYSAVDEIREPSGNYKRPRDYARGARVPGAKPRTLTDTCNPLGKLPGSVWDIPSAPLEVPESLGICHFAAFPPELARRIILGWSPAGICTVCGTGRHPVASRQKEVFYGTGRHVPGAQQMRDGAAVTGFSQPGKWRTSTAITGYACACTPYTDHPGTAGRERTGQGYAGETGRDAHPHGGVGMLPRTGPWREYHLDGWTPPPACPAVIVDPFGGTGTSALVASVLGRIGVTVDRSADYCRLARWRTSDPGERARALGVPKPPPVSGGQGSLFDLREAL